MALPMTTIPAGGSADDYADIIEVTPRPVSMLSGLSTLLNLLRTHRARVGLSADCWGAAGERRIVQGAMGGEPHANRRKCCLLTA